MKMSNEMTIEQARAYIKHASHVLSKHNLGGDTAQMLSRVDFTFTKKIGDLEARVKELEGMIDEPTIIAFRVVNTKGEDSAYRKEWFDRAPKPHEIREIAAAEDHYIQYAYSGPSPIEVNRV
jgi:hypothetical protein